MSSLLRSVPDLHLSDDAHVKSHRSRDHYCRWFHGGHGWRHGLDVWLSFRRPRSGIRRQVHQGPGCCGRWRQQGSDNRGWRGALWRHSEDPGLPDTSTPHDPIEKDGVTYSFVVKDIARAVASAKAAARDRNVALLGGSISRQCLKLDLADELVLHVVPMLLGKGISLFAGLGESIRLERLATSVYASETHLHYRVDSSTD